MGTSAQNGTSGTYVSEDMSTSATWDKIGWVKSIDNTVQSSAGTVDSVEIKTASTQAGLTSATYREVVSGGAINPGACEQWIKVRITYTRPQATWSRADHPGANVWLGESSTFENRNFDTPTIQSLTISSTSGGVAPNTPTTVKQLHSDGVTAIPTGAGTSEDKTVFSANLTSSSASDSLTLQVEIQPLSSSFTGTPNETGSPVACSGGTCSSGVTGTINMIDTPAGSYHWQARSGSSSCGGAQSAWQPYPETPTNGDTPPAALGFQILGADGLMRGGKTFINGAEQSACSTGYCG